MIIITQDYDPASSRRSDEVHIQITLHTSKSIYTALLSKALSSVDIHPFIHTFTPRRRSEPLRVTASGSAAVRVRGLSQGHLLTQLGGAGIQPATLRSPAGLLCLLS